MKLFLDSANLEDIGTAMTSGAVSGVTTNPSIIAKEPKANFVSHCREIAALCDNRPLSMYNRPLSVEVFATDPEAMVQEAVDLHAQIGYHGLNIKIPVSWDNLSVIRRLTGMQIPVNATCIFTTAQAIAAANAGAAYVSVFYNRAKDLGLDPLRTVSEVRAMLDRYIPECEIICGSIRSAKDIQDCIVAGADIVTAGLPQLRAMCTHPGTDTAVAQFTRDFAAWIGGGE